MRDSQRSRVYNAELHGPQIGEGTTREVQAFVDSITGSTWWRARCRIRSVQVKDGRGRSSACAGYDFIKLPRWARNYGTTIHELAHILNHHPSPPHGPGFTGAYLALTKRFLGEEQYREQRQRFRDRRVKVGPMPKPRFDGAKPKMRCGQCGKTAYVDRMWQVLDGGGYRTPRFCTKRCATEWFKRHISQGSA